ncbi:helix-turn-helix transcriptional regulator [Actinomycetospora atypica]|uniref:Helix-turn-helix transcriptional regulator n=1 Tax=Actinomycetospora atypica TaxID=1290095 RepID=A0ABV9YS82_9PSEU
MKAAVEHAVSSMRHRYDEPITLHDLAAEVFVSPFHFSRVFASTVGITPGRFLTAVRLFEAKRRLLDTDDTVADIVCSVGYSSVGTFTSRFTRAVGLTPGQYRDPIIAEGLLAISSEYSRIPSVEVLEHAAGPGPGAASLSVGVVGAGDAGRVAVGVFGGPVPQGAPVALAPVPAGGTGAVLEGLPPGRWVVLAVAGDGTDGAVTSFASCRVEVRAHEDVVPPVELHLGMPQPIHAPLAVSLLDPARGMPGPVPMGSLAVAGRRHLRAVA